MSYTVKVRGRFLTKTYRGVKLHWLEGTRLVLKTDAGAIVSCSDIVNRDYEICSDYQTHKEVQNGVQNSGPG